MSTTINDGGPAFPVGDTVYPNGQIQYGFNGISMRDYFAAKAMEKLIDGFQGDENGYLKTFNGLEADHDKWVSTRAYEIADAMIVARNPGGKA